MTVIGVVRRRDPGVSSLWPPVLLSRSSWPKKKENIYFKKWKRKHIKPNVGIEGLYVVPSPVVVSGSWVLSSPWLVGALERKNLHRSRCEQQGNGVLDQAEIQISSQHLLSLNYLSLEVGRAKNREFSNPIALQQTSLLNALALSSDLKALRSSKPKDKAHRSHARQ